MTQDIAHPVKPLPVGSRAYRFRFIPESDYCFGENLQLPFDSGFGSKVVSIGLKIYVTNEFIDVIDAFLNVTQMRLRVSKRQGQPLVWLSRGQVLASSRGKTNRP